MYIFVVFCLHVTKSKYLKHFKIDEAPKGRLFSEHVVFAAAQREQAKRASNKLHFGYNYISYIQITFTLLFMLLKHN